MVSITLSVPEDLKKNMDNFPDINWSAVAREAIKKRVIMLEKFREFTKSNGFVRMRVTNLYKPFIKIISNSKYNKYDLGDFYFRHYLFLLGFAGETIKHYEELICG